MAAARRKTSEARQRIIETAEQLFYAEGFRGVGIDRIIAEAGVAKMTLYNHFSSKDELILAVLQYREEQVDEMFRQRTQRHLQEGVEPLGAFFLALKEWFESPGFRGCSFINAAVELADASHPASQFSGDHKVRFHKMIRDVLVASAGEKAESVAPAIYLLVEGAIVSAVMENSSGPADVARNTATALITAATRN